MLENTGSLLDLLVHVLPNAHQTHGANLSLPIAKLSHLRSISIYITTQVTIVIIIPIKSRPLLLQYRLIKRRHDVVNFRLLSSHTWLLWLLLHCLRCSESIEKVRIARSVVHWSRLCGLLLGRCTSKVKQIAHDLLLLLLRRHCLKLIRLWPGLREVKDTCHILLLLRCTSSWLLLSDAAPVETRREWILAEFFLLDHWTPRIETDGSTG